MEASKLKNMVVLRNLPSNIVDEAIIILKANKKIKNLELIENSRSQNKEKKDTGNQEYILKEAEMLVSSYISKMEKEESKAKSKDVLKEKYNRLKKYSFFSTLILFISLIVNFI